MDPARVNIILHTRQRTEINDQDTLDTPHAITSKAASMKSPKMISSETPAPWELTVETMGMDILESHLVPPLKSSDKGNTHAFFAIQIILKILSRENVHVLDNNNRNDKNFDIFGKNVPKVEQSFTAYASRPPIGDASRVVGPAPMPQALRIKLYNKQILDITEPFWATTYSLPMNPVSKIDHRPIYESGESVVTLTNFCLCLNQAQIIHIMYTPLMSC